MADLIASARREDAQRFRAYVRRVDGEAWADGISDYRIGRLATEAKGRLRLSGKTRGWLGEVHAILRREREAGSRVD